MSNFSLSINYGFSKMDKDDRFRLLKERGFDGVGLWWGRNLRTFGISKYEQFELAKKYNFKMNYVHGGYYYYQYLGLTGDDHDFGMYKHKEWIDLCHENKADTLVLHVNKLMDTYDYLSPTVIDSLKEINDYAKEKNVRIAVENLGKPHDMEKLFTAIDDIYFCYDSSHANVMGDNNGGLIKEFGEKLLCVHISDNDGINDSHWVPGYGEINFDQIANELQKINYKGLINAEVHATDNYNTPEEFLDDLYKHLERYFGRFNK